ncbi:hypothetical protein LSPH26S_01266 [Lysinibacillus sphaericus]
MFGLYERCLKDARLVSLHTIHGIYRTSMGTESPMFTRIPEMSLMRYSYPLHRCFHETHYTLSKVMLHFLKEIYTGHNMLLQLSKKLCFGVAPACLPRKQYSAPGAGYQLRLPCKRASRSANTLLISCCPSIFVNTPFAS